MRRLVPWIPRPKLIPKWDGMHGVPGDAHLHLEASGTCRGPSCVLEALWRNGRVHIYRDVGAELLQLARVVSCDVAFFCESSLLRDKLLRESSSFLRNNRTSCRRAVLRCKFARRGERPAGRGLGGVISV